MVPVEVVSLCDIDKKILTRAVELISQRHESKKSPRTYSGYRHMLKEENDDIVPIGTPVHCCRGLIRPNRLFRHCRQAT